MSTKPTSPPSIYYAAGTPASRSAWRELERERTTLGIFGPICSESFALYDRDGSCWRTCQGTFQWASDEFSETWPKAGMTRNGIASRLRSLGRRIFGRESSSLPTPCARDSKGAPGPGSTYQSLSRVAEMLPTPTAQTSGSNQGGAAGRVGKVRHSQDSMAKLLPTACATDAKDTRNRTAGRKNPNSKHHSGTTLSDIVWDESTPPTASDGVAPARGRLNPLFSLWLMGFPPDWCDPAMPGDGGETP